MTKIQTLDKYLTEKVELWREEHKIENVSPLDLIEGVLYRKSPRVYINCMRFKNYIELIERTKLLADSETEITLEVASDVLKTLQGYPQEKREELIERAYRNSMEYPRIQGESAGIKNINFTDYLLSIIFNLGENYPIRIIDDGGDSLLRLHDILNQDAQFKDRYQIGSISREFEILGGVAKQFIVEPRNQEPLGGCLVDISHRSTLPDNHLLTIWHGRAIPCANWALDLARILERNDITGAYHLDINEWGILSGAVYDPKQKK